jgi:hypothetical protein
MAPLTRAGRWDGSDIGGNIQALFCPSRDDLRRRPSRLGRSGSA